MTKPTWGPGTVIAGRYRLLDGLGRGGMGEVWRAEHLTLGGIVAVKLISPDVLEKAAGEHDGGENVLARFFQEAQAAAALRSSHVVQIFDHGISEGVPFMVMEVLEGETLGQRLRRIGVLPLAQTARVVTHVARALARAHEAGIIHRDLKPENIFVVHNDDEEIAKVLDFGIAKMTGAPLGPEGPATREGYIVGTPSYMSPEHLSGTHPLDFRSDLWSLGVIAFQCVCGQNPFSGKMFSETVLKVCSRPLPIPSQIAEVPPGFDEWVAKALCREPSGRFRSAKELAEGLRAVLTPDAEEIFESRSARSRRGVQRDGMVSPVGLRRLPQRRKGAVLFGLVLAVAAALAVWGISVHRSPPEPVAAVPGVTDDTPGPRVAPPALTPTVTPSATATLEASANCSASLATSRPPSKPQAPRAPASAKTARPSASVRLGI